MTWNIGDTLSQAEINGIISVFCHFYEHHETFDYSDELIELELADIQILNGIYSDEELIVEPPLKVKITNDSYPNQNYTLGLDYYTYNPDMDDVPPVLKHDYFPLELDGNGVAEISFDDSDVAYIMLTNWSLVVKFNKPVKFEG